MASIQPHKNGYRAQVYVNGVRKSATFRTKREADAWASSIENDIRKGEHKQSNGKTLRDALDRFIIEEIPKKRSQKWFINRSNYHIENIEFIDKKLSDITTDMFARERDKWLLKKKAGTVIRDLNFLSSVFNVARREWKWIDKNPLTDVRRPKRPDPRNKVYRWQVIKKILRELTYSPGKEVKNSIQSIGVGMLISMRTGMRLSELVTLTWANVYPDYVHLGKTKTKPRNVPLSKKAVRLINKLHGLDKVKLFDISPDSFGTLFRRYRDKAGVEGYTFHDTRHTGATFYAGRDNPLPILDLTLMFGWSDPKQALVYYNPSASDISKKL